MAYVVRFTRDRQPIPSLTGKCPVNIAESIVGRWVSAGYGLGVYYIDAREEDEFGPLSACVVVAWESSLNSHAGVLVGSVWMLESETGEVEEWS